MSVSTWRRFSCRRCGTALTLVNKYGTKSGGICRDCNSALMKVRDPKKRHDYWIKYRTENPERVAEIARKKRMKLKSEVLSHYSGGAIACARCGHSDIRALGLDHIDGNGAEQRKRGLAGNVFYAWLKKNHFPEGLQVLCMNCNWVKRVENNELSRARLGT